MKCFAGDDLSMRSANEVVGPYEAVEDTLLC
jgi:hypothetical protein